MSFTTATAAWATVVWATGFFSTAVLAQNDPAWLNQLSLRGNVTLFTGPALDAHQPFTSLVNSASQSVLMEMYHLLDPAVLNALTSAQARGVQTDVIMDGSSLRTPMYQNVKSMLDHAGVSFFASSPGFSITHSKAVVVDSRQAIVSSMNLTEHPEVRRDYGVVIEDPGVIAEMESVFTADIANSKSGTDQTPPLRDPHLLWSPVNSRTKLQELIASARVSIVAVAENVIDQDTLSDLIAAASRGVAVKVLSPACPLGQKPDANFEAARKLVAGGVDARQMPDPATPATPYLHGKMMVVDSKAAYIGSINFSYNSLNKARELGIVLNSSEVISGLTDAFAQDFSNARNPGQLPVSCASFSQ